MSLHRPRDKQLRLKLGLLFSSPVEYARRFFFFPALWVTGRMLFSTEVFERHHGIVIAEFGPEAQLDPNFVPSTREALDYLARYDGRRFRRVQREIRAILKARSSVQYRARYQTEIRVCIVNVDSLGFDEDYANAVDLYARTLVHEATHGRIVGRGIHANRWTRARIERICTIEENRLRTHNCSQCNQVIQAESSSSGRQCGQAVPALKLKDSE